MADLPESSVAGAGPPPSPVPPATERGWRQRAGTVSLPEIHGSVPVPVTAGFWRKLLAFAGPGYLVAVGYMDPGNWATDLAGGSRYGYTLLSVIMLSNLMAILLQALSARLGSSAAAISRRPAAIISRVASPWSSGCSARSRLPRAISRK